MPVHDAFLQFVSLLLGALGTAVLVIVPSFSAYVKHRLDSLSAVQASNTARVANLENGGGDAKTDARLAQHGLSLTPDLPGTKLVPGTTEVEVASH